jgi:hypothetical protein
MERQFIEAMVENVWEGQAPGEVIQTALSEAKKKKGKKGKGGAWIQKQQKKPKWKGAKKIAGSTSAKEIAAALAKGSKTLKQATDRLNYFINRSGQGYNWSDKMYKANTDALLALPKMFKK